ncbi:MAG: HAMP domain-containing histidine kinase [Burkholderiales bacterium]|nr:HAMP domain-containing histidine kinase [Burkholderiales bacterium]
MRLVRRALLILLAALLAAVLGFLYYKTQGVDFARQVRVNEHLRNLKAIDAQWNESILRSRTELLAVDAGGALPRDPVARELSGLAEEARAMNHPVLVAGVASLATLYDRKLDLMTDYWRRATAFRNALRELLAALPPAQLQVREAAAQPGARVPEYLRTDLDQLAALAIEFSSISDDALAEQITAVEARLLAGATWLPPGAREPVMLVSTRLATMRQTKPGRDTLYQQLSFFPTAPRTDTLGASFAQSFQVEVDERELYRVYLIAYSAALLIFLGYVGVQLFRSYRVINDVNAKLKRANETLEHKVSARTRELSDALKHLKESETMLVQSEKMSSLGQMVAGVAHEINTPLAYVKSSLETITTQLPSISSIVHETEVLLAMLQQGQATEAEVTDQFARVAEMAEALREHEAVDTMEKLVKDGLYGIDQIADLVANLKDFSRLDRNKVARFDLREGLESTLQIARNLVKHKDVRKVFGEIPLVSCSPSQINQVFLNLVTNAAQATPENGGIIRITTRHASPAEVTVDVEDNGHGIPPDVVPKIFDPFFTTKDVGKGTGLGLSIAYKIVQQHGGRIDVKSVVGKGTRFTVTLPVEPAAPA